jgi:8-oxo-dGTP pyrophosphatase MutT (NUDIX family)
MMEGASTDPRRPLIPRFLIRFAATAFQRLRRASRFLARSEVSGVHAVPLTPQGRVVLVRLTYAKGWRLPGGGRGASEEPVAAILRELREEIGLVSHGAVEPLGEVDQKPDFRRDRSFLFLIRDVAYRPRQTLEIEEVSEFDPGHLPAGATPWTRRTVAGLGLESERPDAAT